MIGCVDSSGDVIYITKMEDFEDLVSSNVYSALCEWNDNINYTYKEQYEDLKSEYDSLEEDYDDIERDKGFLEDEISELEDDINKLQNKLQNGIELIKLFMYDELTSNSHQKDRLIQIIKDLE